ncbi:MAG: enoyl-CoA hydratase/isomerase family protein [Cyclobacteriaceae bacterium]
MENVLLEIKERIGFITLNRANKRNALSIELVKELDASLAECEINPEVRVLIIRAKGKAFCAGADLADIQKLQTNTYNENLEDSQYLKKLFYRIYKFSKPIIAQIQGHAIAGGAGLAAVCDFSFAVPEAKFGYTEVKIGFIPAIVSVFLLRKIGEGHAREMLVGGRLYSAEDVRQMGMINKVVPAENLESFTYEFAKDLIKSNSGESMMKTKLLIATIQEMTLEAGLDTAAELNARMRGSDDCKKGVGAFLNKEDLVW